jgi:hypothetical protein
LHLEGHIHFQVNKWMSFGLIVLIFLASYFYARRQGPVPDEQDEATELFTEGNRKGKREKGGKGNNCL